MINLHNWLTKLIEAFTFYGGGGKGGGGDTTTVQKSDPWVGVQPYIRRGLARNEQVSNNPFQFYNGDTIAGFSPEQELGMNMQTQRALAGSPTLNAANRNITSTLQGNFLSPDSNPFLKGTVDQALGDVQTRVNSQFNNSNFGGSAHQEMLTRDLGNQANNLYGQNYSMERNNQLQAATQAPSLAASDYQDAAMLQGVGAQRQGLAQSYLNDARSQFDLAAQWPYIQNDRNLNGISVGMGTGGTSTTTQQLPESSRLAGAVGGGLTGYGVASTLGMANPWLGAAGGAVLGLLG